MKKSLSQFLAACLDQIGGLSPPSYVILDRSTSSDLQFLYL